MLTNSAIYTVNRRGLLKYHHFCRKKIQNNYSETAKNVQFPIFYFKSMESFNCHSDWAPRYQKNFMLISEHEIFNAHKYKSIKKFIFFKAQ